MSRTFLVALLFVPAGVLAGENPDGRTTIGDVGDVLEFAMPIAALTGTILNEDKQGARQFAYGLMTTLAVTHGLKSVISKERPDGRDDKSFPSSHTAVAMHTAGYVQERYGWKLGGPAYALAAFVGYSRIHDDRHDEQDVLAGAVMGYVAARYFTTRHEDLTVTPVLTPDGGMALNLTYRF